MSLRYQAGTLAILLSTFAAQTGRADDALIEEGTLAGAISEGALIVDGDPDEAAAIEGEGVATTSHGVAGGPAPGYGPVPPPASPYHCPPNVYPRMNAPLYPAPVQYTPSWNGGAVITNQAFAPHEMLYPHKYHAMYPPYYYKVHGSWYWTPFGMRQHESWKLEGTEVIVNYRPRIKLFSGFHPPRS
jgi:hypothetical protein